MSTPPPGPDVLVAIPAYNCERQIPRVLAELDARLLARVRRVIVIDNRSRDGTVEAATQAATRAAKQLGTDKIEVFRNDDNYGLGGSHKVAFLRAEREGADYVAIVHGDNQAKTDELHLLLDEAALEPSYAAVLGARFAPGSHLRGYSALRIGGNIALNALFTLLSGRVTLDLGSGLNLFRVEDLRDRAYLTFADDLTFNVDLLLDYYRKKSRLKRVPITWSETDQVSNARIFNVGFGALEKLLRWRIGRSARVPNAAERYTSTRVG